MEKLDLRSLEQTLASLPVSIKKYPSDQLLGQISSQESTLIDTFKTPFLCPHCDGENTVK